MGVAGAGKSMQGRILADEHGYAWISTGEILRVLITGKRRQEMIQGKLLSDDEIIGVIDKVFELIDTKQEFVLDGFPRTIPQAEWLIEQVKKGRFELNSVIDLIASQDVVVERLLKRGRLDDTRETILRRIENYHQVTAPILEYFRGQDVPIHEIDGDRNARVIHDEILSIIDDGKHAKGSVFAVAPELA